MSVSATSGHVRSFKDLVIWQDAMKLAKSVYDLSAQLPKEERYGLSAQLRRAAVSVPSNIAEGQARGHRMEYRQHLYIALGSLAELETQLLLARDLGLVSSVDEALTAVERIHDMVIRLARKL